MSNVSNAKNVSKGIYVELSKATVDSVTLNGVIINGYTFTLTERTERVGFEKFEKGMQVDLKAYLDQKNILYLNSVSLSGFETYHVTIYSVYESNGSVRVDMSVSEWDYMSCNEATCSVSSHVLEQYTIEQLKAMKGKKAVIGVIEHKNRIISLEPAKELKNVKAENLRYNTSIELNGKTYKMNGFSYFDGEDIFRIKFDGKALVDAWVYESEGIIANIKLSKDQSGKNDVNAKEQADKTQTTKPANGSIKELSKVTITAVGEKSISIDENEYYFSKHTELPFEPQAGMIVDAVVFETVKGRFYVNSISLAESADVADVTKDFSNNSRIYGYISAVTDKAIRIGNQWFNTTEKSVVDSKVVWEKGEYVVVYYYFSPKGGNYINKVFTATDKYAQKSA